MFQCTFVAISLAVSATDRGTFSIADIWTAIISFTPAFSSVGHNHPGSTFAGIMFQCTFVAISLAVSATDRGTFSIADIWTAIIGLCWLGPSLNHNPCRNQQDC